MSKSTVKVVEIDTNPAVKSIKDLRKELMEYKNQMANLEEGSDAFLEIANKAGEVKHQIDEINESVKGASADFGDMVGNVTNVAAGITGAFQAVAGGLQAMGVESEALDKTIAKMQGLMAVTQGLSAIDDGIKSFDKLTTSINGTTKAGAALKAVLQPKVLLAIAAVITTIVLAFKNWEGAIRDALPFVDKICNAFGRVHPDIKKATEEQEKFNQKIREQYEIMKTEQERISGEADRIRLNRRMEVLTEDAKAKLKRAQEDLILSQDNYNKALMKRTEVVMSGDAFALKVLDAQLKSYTASIEKNKTLIESILKDNKWVKKEETPIQREKIEPLEPLSVPVLLEVAPLSTPSMEEMGERLGKALADSEIKARNRRWKEEVENINNAGNEAFEQLKDTMGMFGESSLGLTSGWIKSLDVFQTAFQQTMDIVKDEGTVGWERYAQVATTSLSGIGTVLNALSQEQDASTEEGFKKTKQLQIAATVMNMLSGIMNAWTSAMSPANAWMTVAGQIAMGTAMSGMVAGIGAAQIEKIKNATMSSANPNTNINAKSVNSMIIPPVQYSNAVQGANTQGAITNQRVYVLESDISKTTKAVVTQTEENIY